jgi:exonuclease SbcC
VVDGGRRHAEAAARLAAVAPEWTRAQAERERVQELQGEQRAAEGEEQALLRELERLRRELGDAAAARAELARLVAALAPLAALQDELRTLDRLGTAEGRRSALDDQERAALGDLAQIEERRARLAAAPEYERETQQLLAERKTESAAADADHGREHTAWVRDQQEAQTRLEALRTQYEEARAHRERVAALGPESPCPTCTRPLGASYRTVLDTLDEQLDTLRGDGQYYRGRVKQLESEPGPVAQLGERRRQLAADVAVLERRLAKCQAAVLELAGVDREVAQRQERVAQARRALAQLPTGYDAARHTAVRAEVARLAPLESERARADALVSREAQALAAQARAAGALEAARARLGAIAERRTAIAFSEERHAELRQAYQDASDAARAAELALVRAQGDERTARDALGHAERQRAELARVEARLDALQTERRLHDELDRAYTDLRQDLNFQLRPELSELASGFLDQLTDGRYAELELDDQYNVVVLEDGIPKPVISGGEEDLANLVLRLAISQMIADRAGQSFSLLILDEVFGSLDETRRANVVELLRRLHDRFEQVVVITHIEDVREGLDRVLRVRFDETRGAAVVEEEDELLAEPLGVLVDALEEVA